MYHICMYSLDYVLMTPRYARGSEWLERGFDYGSGLARTAFSSVKHSASPHANHAHTYTDTHTTRVKVIFVLIRGVVEHEVTHGGVDIMMKGTTISKTTGQR